MRWSPGAQQDFIYRKSRKKAKFVSGGVNGIPERFKSPATTLGEHFPGPYGLVGFLFSDFEGVALCERPLTLIGSV